MNGSALRNVHPTGSRETPAGPPDVLSVAVDQAWKPRVLRLAARWADGGLALLDQALVSGGRFATSVLVGRLCGEDPLGRYTLGFTAALLILCLQESLISVPYVVYCQRWSAEERRWLAGSTLVHTGLLGLVASLALGLAAALLGISATMPGLVAVAFALACSLPWMLLREFARRLHFGHLDPRGALWLDLAVTLVQLLSLGCLVAAGRLSPATAHLSVGAGCAVVGLVWLLHAARHTIRIRPQRVLSDFRDHWRFGRWLFASQMVFLLQWNGVTWLLAILAGEHETGAFAACLTLALLCNPFLLGMSNLVEPRIAEAAARGGPARVGRLVFQWTALMAPVVAVFCLLVALLGGPALGWLYGESFARYSGTLLVMALTVLAGTCGLAADAGLRALERSDAGFRINVASLLVALLLAAALIPHWGSLGAALGMLGGSATGTAARLVWLATLLTVPPCPRTESASVREAG